MHDSTFGYLKPTPEQTETMANVRSEFKRICDAIEKHVPKGRYSSLAITSIEEAAMWANKGITRDSDGTPRDGAEVGG